MGVEQGGRIAVMYETSHRSDHMHNKYGINLWTKPAPFVGMDLVCRACLFVCILRGHQQLLKIPLPSPLKVLVLHVQRWKPYLLCTIFFFKSKL